LIKKIKKWMGSVGFIYFDVQENWTFYREASSDLPSDDVRDFLQDNSGNIWICNLWWNTENSRRDMDSYNEQTRECL
jgi:ligand-binding sensor domain-containing protein